MNSNPTVHQDSAAPDAPYALSGAGQLRCIAALAVSAVIFFTVGRLAIEPIDPLGPVSLLAVPHKLRTVAVLLALAIAAAVLAVVVAGRLTRFVAAGAVAVGLAALAWRGGRSDRIGGYLAGGEGLPAWPAVGFIVELWTWLALIGLGLFIGRMASRDGPTGGDPDLPAIGRGGLNIGVRDLAAAGLSAAVAYVLLRTFGGEPLDEVLRQQVYFAVGISFFASGAAAQWLLKPARLGWTLIAVGVLGAAVYLTGAPRGGEGAQLALRGMSNIPARPLPIEYAALGAAGGLLGVWFACSSSAAANSPTRTDKMQAA